MSKQQQAVKEVRKLQKVHFDKSMFCKQHNMTLDQELHIRMERELSTLAMKLEDILQTGYVNWE